MLSVIDEKGVATAKQALLYSVALLPLTLAPTVWGVAGKFYFLGAAALGLGFIASSMSLAVHRSKVYAKRLFLVSIIYLPMLGLLMVWDRIY
jgi:protoheme IX farnesyltransferase